VLLGTLQSSSQPHINEQFRQASLTACQDYVHIKFSAPRRVLSCAVLNGGVTRAEHLLNLRVAQTFNSSQAPAETLAAYATRSGWSGKVVGMMTAASMNSLRISQRIVDGVEIAVVVTAGLSNPRRVADRADYRNMTEQTLKSGTINIGVLTSANLTDSALVEALMIVTEAKAAALQDANIKSTLSDNIATGTGTDAVAIVCGEGPETVVYCGQHVLIGEELGALVMEAVTASITAVCD
jgi:adenosylcobinamide amidohydrolase